MRNLDSKMRAAIEKKDDEWVKAAQTLAKNMQQQKNGKFVDKKGQLRNLQAAAERSDSWLAFELFLNYQAARGELDTQWTRKAIAALNDLHGAAANLAGGSREMEPDVHMEIVARVLGFAVRWHIAYLVGVIQEKSQ